MVRTVVRIENLIIVIVALLMISSDYTRWHWYLLCIALPDISLLGYLVSKRVGSIAYNLFHNYAFGLILIVLGVLFPKIPFTYLGIGAIIHVGIDRFFGFGLKYKDSFKKTHIQKL